MADIFDQLAPATTAPAAAAPAASGGDVFDQIATPKGGPIISAQPSVDTRAQQVEQDHPVISAVAEGTPVAGALTMPLIKGLLNVHDKLREVENMTQEGKQAHPIQAEVGQLANRIKGLLVGNEAHPEDSIGTGKYGLTNNPITGSIMASDSAATPALAKAIEGGANVVKAGVQGAKSLAGALKSPAGEVQEGIAALAKDAGGATADIKPTAADPYGFRQVAEEQIGRYKAVAQKLDDLSGNAFSDAQQDVADASEDFTAAGKKAYREAQSKLDGIIDKYRPQLEAAGQDVDSMKADYKAAMANQKIASFLSKTTEESGKGAPMATAKLGPGLKEAFLDLMQNQKGLLERAGWSDEHINSAINLARKLASTANTRATAGKIAGTVAGSGAGLELLHKISEH